MYQAEAPKFNWQIYELKRTMSRPTFEAPRKSTLGNSANVEQPDQFRQALSKEQPDARSYGLSDVQSARGRHVNNTSDR